MIVADASVALKWVLDEPGEREARAIIATGEPLIAPELIVAEVVNVAWKRLLSGEITSRQATVIAAEVPRVFAELSAIGPLRMIEIATELRHPVHDCFYLALAEARNAKLITADRRMVAKLTGSRWKDRCATLWS
jgi:predicted nucleic acid-binding protein